MADAHWGKRGGKRAKLATTGLRPVADKLADLLTLNELLAQDVVRPVTDRMFPLTQVADAHRYVESETKAGDVLVVMPVAWPDQAAKMTSTLVPGPSP